MGQNDVLEVLRDPRHRRRILRDSLLYTAPLLAFLWVMQTQSGVYSVSERVLWLLGGGALFFGVRAYHLALWVRQPHPALFSRRNAILWSLLAVTWLLLYFVVL